MRVRMSPFPLVTMVMTCKEHDCLVEFNTRQDHPAGAEFIPMRCKKGGTPQQTINCTSSWEMSIHTSGDATVSIR